MHKGKKVEKNMAEEIKDSIVEKYNFIPRKSVGLFILGNNIDRYRLLPFYKTCHRTKLDSYDSYDFYEDHIIVWVEKDKIQNICCKTACYWKGNNLINMKYDEFVEKYQLIPDDSDNIYLLVNGHGQNQKVYDFDKIGLQIWVWRKKIVTVIVSK